MRRIQGIVFDLDGTLADTLATIAGAVNHSLAAMGLPEHPLDAYRTMVGDGVVLLCERALSPEDAGRHAELLRRVRERYSTHIMDRTRLYDGIHELLTALRDRGVRLGVLSNKPDALTRGTMDGLGIAPFFECILGERPDLPRKPDPAGARRILEHLGLPREAVLYVGDTPTDMQTARAAGLVAVAVLWGFRGRDELLAHGADRLVEHPREILDLLD